MEQETLTERQLASRMKSRNYIPSEARNPEKVQELRKARKQAKREHTIKRKAALKARRIAYLNTLEDEVTNDFAKDFDNTTKNKKYSLSGFWCFNTNNFGMEYSPKSKISGAIRITGIENQDRLKDTKSLKVVRNMHFLMDFILSNPRMLKLLDEFNTEFIHYLIGTRNMINMLLKLNKENKTSYKERKQLKRPKWARMRYLGIGYFDSDSD